MAKIPPKPDGGQELQKHGEHPQGFGGESGKITTWAEPAPRNKA